MPRPLELFDTVALKSDPKLVAIVERTSYNPGHDLPLDERLIIAHAYVQDDLLTTFVKSGIPPPRHVFVEFADQTQGSALVHEDDLELLDRSFTLGDNVKKEGSQMLGTVVNVAGSYTLQPVWRNAPNTPLNGSSVVPADDLDIENVHFCTDACPLNLPNRSLYTYPCQILANIPGHEIKKAADSLEGDFIVKDDWLGVVEDVVTSVIVMTADGSIAVVQKPEELYIPMPNFGDKPLVSLPEYDDLPRPDIVVAQAGYSAAIPLLPDDYHSGQLVIASRRNLKNARWLRGEYNGLSVQSIRVLDVRTSHLEVRWLTCNPFIPSYNPENGSHWLPTPPNEKVSLYENMKTFPHRKELRRDKHVTILDLGRIPTTVDDRRRNRSAAPAHTSKVVSAGDIRIGDHVKFRDPAGAAVKYQGVWHDGALHNRFERITSDNTLGFDMNELKIMASQQTVHIKWQDGTVTEHLSKTLDRYSLFETDLAPADIVVSREGMQQRLATSPPGPWMEFNEMKFLQGEYDLRPQKVGIIQNIDPTERVASVRWYTRPNIHLTHHGHSIDADSRFGQIEPTSEDVSVYEVMKFPILERRVKDLVIMAPAAPETFAVQEIAGLEASKPHLRQVTALSSIQYEIMLQHLRHAARAIVTGQSFKETRNEKKYKLQPSLDWIGEVVHIGTDGILTVRISTGQQHQDLLVEHDQIIAFVDEHLISGPASDELFGSEAMSIDSEYDSDESSGFGDSDTASAISETIEYEGGKRLDDDSDNENWEDLDDMVQDEDEPDEKFEDAVMVNTDGKDVQTSGSPADRISRMIANSSLRAARLPETSQSTSDSELNSPSGREPRASDRGTPLFQLITPSEKPAQFEILSQEPPADQFNASVTRTPSTTMLKRIMKEHRILANSLPKGEIFVRTYENRLDLIRCLIIGPRDTPYEYAPFLIDLHLGHNFPREPPTAHFHSWTSGMGRVNPNLYEEGKICLSLLGTWHGRQDTEGWSPDSTLLQLLISLQGLVLTRRPFYNEAGYEEYGDQDLYKNESQLYNEKTYIMSRRFVEHVLTSPVAGLEDVLSWLYLPRESSSGFTMEVVERSRRLIESSRNTSNPGMTNNDQLIMDGTGSTDDPTKVFLKPLSRGAMVMLERTIKVLEGLVNV